MALKMWPSLVVPRRTSGRAPLAAALAAALDEAALAALELAAEELALALDEAALAAALELEAPEELHPARITLAAVAALSPRKLLLVM